MKMVSSGVSVSSVASVVSAGSVGLDASVSEAGAPSLLAQALSANTLKASSQIFDRPLEYIGFSLFVFTVPVTLTILAYDSLQVEAKSGNEGGLNRFAT